MLRDPRQSLAGSNNVANTTASCPSLLCSYEHGREVGNEVVDVDIETRRTIKVAVADRPAHVPDEARNRVTLWGKLDSLVCPTHSRTLQPASDKVKVIENRSFVIYFRNV